ncbi:MAG TPA: hypothetical protein PLS53_14560, partial [Thermoanaerobaculaceae bacterium]|nr:hypothetical protein [Thermoanaerobaculaceae bacterium]
MRPVASGQAEAGAAIVAEGSACEAVVTTVAAVEEGSATEATVTVTMSTAQAADPTGTVTCTENVASPQGSTGPTSAGATVGQVLPATDTVKLSASLPGLWTFRRAVNVCPRPVLPATSGGVNPIPCELVATQRIAADGTPQEFPASRAS